MDLTVNIIYDARRSEKYEPLMEELKTQGILDFTIWPAIMQNDIVESISESFKMVVRDAKEKGLKECLIMEDDCFFSSPNGWGYFLKNKPEKYSLYLGGNYLIDNRTEYKAPLTRINEYIGNQLLLINETYYDTFLNVDSKLHIDQAQNGLGEFYVCFPFVALQRPGWSANNQAPCNYNALLKDEYIYK